LDGDGRAKGVAYVDRPSKREVEAHGRAVVLASSCLETVHIMVNSNSSTRSRRAGGDKTKAARE
jgi:hypothetical protein